MRHGNPQFDPRIVEARRKAKAAESALRRTVREVQKTCKHPAVAHRDWRPSKYFSPFPGTRICVTCGFEEHYQFGTASYWPSGPQTDHSGNGLESGYSRKSKLDKKPIIITDDINKYRPV